MKKDKLANIIHDNLVDLAEKKFGSTARLNEDLVKKLALGNTFPADIEKLRKAIEMPKLNIDDDVDLKKFSDPNFPESEWFKNNIENNDRKFTIYNNSFNEIVARYNLPFYFRNWLKEYILYGQPDWIPESPLFYGPDLILSKEWPKNIRLTTEEKRFLLSEFRRIFGMPETGRMPREYTEAYKYFRNYLDDPSNKNRNRKLKNLEQGQWISENYGKIETNWDCSNKLNFNDLAGRVNDKTRSKSKKADKKRAANLRKISERFKKQVEFKNS
jgi:hypothetical protein